MPELPEVETVKRGLEPVLTDAKILTAKTNRANLRYPFPENFSKILIGLKVIALTRRAKYLLIHLSSHETIISHLGMSGSWRIENELLHDDYFTKGKLSVHDHFEMQVFTNKHQTLHIIYNDPRRFGFIELVKTETLNDHPILSKLGVEPTGNTLSGHYLQKIFANKKAPLKAALLDQSLIAGLGNIYVCEALWRAGLSPERPAYTLALHSKKAQTSAALLAVSIRDVIHEAIIAGGSSLKDYVQTDGSLGYFQHRFSVYNRMGEKCRRCQKPIQRITQSGRSSFYCAYCQK
ncbi:bifunctional DNA-formamidopyrimidine glycosylase/DNA-(apurinic or apyrimidinic site) lyase [Bartonella tamiae]|uniref:Formamidopyrimidine-DNA glycosylase n=1 Tax=Bartonella tamiae Th239 TaxID=1094558 RepID=J1JZT8_9HYPH|nr:bifunctional DNA-formamidopyrimidine glycosylase/DNA-(apurinic or apyrimidinic site) lyase [Bartonella tamiae]EJF90270.1 formamidopyrimidine-DNA glycosylase [Bartonella tamiae Th239]EJF93789.1 formamidopyrimidine-DNA glycosylase [Bartonella tamiae Th307]